MHSPTISKKPLCSLPPCSSSTVSEITEDIAPYLGVSRCQLWRFCPKHPANMSPGSDRDSGRQHHMTQVTSSCLWDSWRRHVLNSFLKYILCKEQVNFLSQTLISGDSTKSSESLGVAIGNCLREMKQEHETRLTLHPFSFPTVSYPSETLPL